MENLKECLDHTYKQLIEAPTTDQIDELSTNLNEFYDQACVSGKLANFRKTCQEHTLHKVLLEDPYTERAFSKPRGYAGDAVMLDYIYVPKKINLTTTGDIIHRATTNHSDAKSILFRKQYIQSTITNLAKKKPGKSIFSVASGHMRELDESSIDLRNTQITALDIDKQSLEFAVKEHSTLNIEALHRSVFMLPKNTEKKKYDLIYSAGLCDYLSDRLTGLLLKLLFTMLNKEGKLIVANFTPESKGRGYMVGMMDWQLIYRSDEDIVELICKYLPGVEFITFFDPFGNVVYAEIYR